MLPQLLVFTGKYAAVLKFGVIKIFMSLYDFISDYCFMNVLVARQRFYSGLVALLAASPISGFWFRGTVSNIEYLVANKTLFHFRANISIAVV